MAHIAERACTHYLPIVLRLHGHLLPEPAPGGRPTCRRCGRPGSSPCRASGRSSRPRIEAGIEAEQDAEKKQATQWALDVGLQQGARRAGRRGGARGAARPSTRKADELVLSKIRARARASTSVESVNVGAAPTPREVIEFFHAHRHAAGRAVGHVGDDCGAARCNPPEQHQDRHRRPAGAGRRDQARRRRRGPDPRPGRHGRLPQPAGEDRARRSTTTAGSTPATSASSTRTAT